MREEIAYKEMQEEMNREQQARRMDPTMKGQQAGPRAGTMDPTRKDEAANIDAATRQADRRDARREPGPDRMPSAEEERAADGARMPAGVAESYEEALERGARQKGEGRIE